MVKLSMFLQHMMPLVKKLCSYGWVWIQAYPFFLSSSSSSSSSSFFFFKELYRKSIELACGYMPDNYFGIFDNILCGFCSVRHAINQKEEKRE
jgi:hypothetical protein